MAEESHPVFARGTPFLLPSSPPGPSHSRTLTPTPSSLSLSRQALQPCSDAPTSTPAFSDTVSSRKVPGPSHTFPSTSSTLSPALLVPQPLSCPPARLCPPQQGRRERREGGTFLSQCGDGFWKNLDSAGSFRGGGEGRGDGETFFLFFFSFFKNDK